MSLISSRIGVVMVLAILALAPCVQAIESSRQGVDYWLQQRGEEYENQVVKVFAFNTNLTIFEEDPDDAGPLEEQIIGFQVTWDLQASSFTTASVIGDRYLLTSARSIIPYGMFQTEINGQTYLAEQWWMPNINSAAPDGVSLWDHDIAIIKLDRPIEGVSPLGYAGMPGSTPQNYQGEEFTMVGFGATNGAVADPMMGPGVLRAAENKFDVEDSPGFLGQVLSLTYDLDPLTPPIDQVDFDWETDLGLPFEGMYVPEGDAGAPAIVGNTVVGVFGGTYTSPLDDTRTYGFSTRVDRFDSWINAIVQNETLLGHTEFSTFWGIAGISINDIFTEGVEFSAFLESEDYIDLATLFTGSTSRLPDVLLQALSGSSITSVTATTPPTTASLVAAAAYFESLGLPSGTQMEDLLLQAVAIYLNAYPHAALDEKLMSNLQAAITSNFTQPGVTPPYGQGNILPGDFNVDGVVDLDDLIYFLDNNYITGDANKDGYVDQLDFAIVESQLGTIGTADGQLLGDANGDGRVDGEDLLIVERNFGRSILSEFGGTLPVPEPAAAALLSFGAFALLRRRRA